MTDPVKILLITHYLDYPPKSGGALRILSPLFKMNEKSGLSFDILFSTFENWFAEHCKINLEKYPVINYVEGVVTLFHERVKEGTPNGFSEDVWITMSRELNERLIQLLSEKTYDIIQIEHSQMSWIVPTVRKYSPKSHVVLDCHNVEYLIYERWLKYASKETYKNINRKYDTLKRWENKVWKWYDSAFCVSPVEEEILRNEGIQNTYLVPTGGGIDPNKYCPKTDDSEKPLDIIYIGTMAWYPNAHGLLWFIKEVFPKIVSKKENINLNIIGMGEPYGELLNETTKHKNITFWGMQKDDVEFFHKGKVFIVPLWIGAGARVKIITAWASKIPIVSTVLGAEGNEARNGENILLADDPDDFAKKVIELLDNPELSKMITKNAFQLLCEKYSVQHTVDLLIEDYHKMIENAN